MKQIRRGTFETNSSSVHSLVIENEKKIGELEKSQLKLNKKGEIEVQLGKYGWGLSFLTTQQEKLNYLVTLIVGSKIIIDCDDLEDDPEFEYLKKELLKYTNAKNIKVYGFGKNNYYIDHQSQKDLSEFLNSYNTETVLKNIYSWETKKETELIGPLDVIFNPNIIIEIYHD
jgi:hypothetical protein